MKRERKKKIINFNLLMKDIYDWKKIWFYTALACLSIYILFKSQYVELSLASIAGLWLCLREMNKQTIKSFALQEENYFIAYKTMCADKIVVKLKNGKFTIDAKSLPKMNIGEKFYLIFVNNAPVYAYSEEEFTLSEELKKKVIEEIV